MQQILIGLRYKSILLVMTLSFFTTLIGQVKKIPDTSMVRQLDEVVVTGQYSPQSLKNSVYNVRVIDQQRIRMRGATDVISVLNNELGVRFSTDYTLNETNISMQGMGSQHVKILLDGIPLVDRNTTKQSLSQVDINSVERIEIVEGPMSTTYGTDALAGVINIITKKSKGANHFSVLVKAQESSVGNTYWPFTDDGIHNESIGINWSNKTWQLSGYTTRNNFGGYTDTAAWPAQVAKPKNQTMGGGTVGFRSHRINAWYRIDYLHENIFSAGVMNTNTGKAIDQYFITDRYTHQAQADWQATDHLKMNSALSYQDYSRNTETYNRDYVAGTRLPAVGEGYWDIAHFRTWFFRSTGQLVLSPRVSLQPGIEYKNDETSGDRVAGSPVITDYSVFASAEIKPVAGINIRPGLRFSKNSVYEAPPVIPSISAKFSLTQKLDLRLSYGRGFRAPVLRELYFYFHDANHDIDGNPNLKAETSNSFTAALTRQNSKPGAGLQFVSTLSAFFNAIQNEITLAQVTGTSTYTYINLSQTKSIGTHIINTISYKNLSATAGVSYIGYYNPYSNDNSVIGNHTSFTWTPEISSNITYSIPKLKASIGIFYKFTGALPSWQTSNNSVYLSKVQSYHLADLTAIKEIFSYFTLQAGIKNLFDVTRLQNSSLNTSGAHSAGGPVLTGYGRSYFMGLAFQWSKK